MAVAVFPRHGRRAQESLAQGVEGEEERDK